MARTLNYTVQRVLEKLNLDPVNSINDTEDAILVAREAESTFYELMSRGDWPFNEELLKVESVSDINNPTALKLPDNINHIESLRYDITETGETKKEIRRIEWLEPEDFLEKMYRRNTEEENVEVKDFFGTEVILYNNTAPTYYTSFDNKYLLLDSYDLNESQTLLGTKSICYGSVIPSWNIEDNYVIPIDEKIYPLFLSALTSACSIMLLNTQHPEEERRQMRGISRMRREAYTTEAEYFPKFKYGRNGNGLA